MHSTSYLLPDCCHSPTASHKLIARATNARRGLPFAGSARRGFALQHLEPRAVMSVAVWAASLIAITVYIPSLFSEFVRDDRWQIVSNPEIQSWDYLLRLFATHLWSQSGTEYAVHFYRPFFSVWMLVIATIGGISPVWWHLSSIFLNAAATFAIYNLTEKLLQSVAGASFAAIMFAVYPIHVDAVSWVSASNEILFTLFALAAILAVLPQDTDAPLKTSQLATSSIFYSAALLTKETAVVIGPILLLTVLLQKQRAKAVTSGFWYLSATAAYFIARWRALHRIGTEESKHTWHEVLWTSPTVLAFYLKKLLFPVHLSSFYVNPIFSTPTRGMWITVGGLLIAVAVVIWIAVRYSPLVGIATSIIVLPLLPALLAIRIYDQGDMTHDRYLYLPSVGLCLFFGLLARWVWTRPKAVGVIFTTATAAILLAFAVLTIHRQRFYKTNEAFYKRAIDLDPTNVYAIDGFGAIHLENGEWDLAMNEFRIAYQLAPSDPNAIYNLAHGFFEMHQYAEAEPLFRKVVDSPELASRRKPVLLALADTEISLGNLSDAMEVLERLQGLDAKFPALHRTLGIVFQREGRITEAQAEYHKEFQVSGDMQAERQAIALEQVLSSPH
jgi:protein O-mannosyl-transferase